MSFKERMSDAWRSVSRDPATLMAIVNLVIAIGDLVARAIKAHRDAYRPRPHDTPFDPDLF